MNDICKTECPVISFTEMVALKALFLCILFHRYQIVQQLLWAMGVGEEERLWYSRSHFELKSIFYWTANQMTHHFILITASTGSLVNKPANWNAKNNILVKMNLFHLVNTLATSRRVNFDVKSLLKNFLFLKCTWCKGIAYSH